MVDKKVKKKGSKKSKKTTVEVVDVEAKNDVIVESNYEKVEEKVEEKATNDNTNLTREINVGDFVVKQTIGSGGE